MAVLLSPQLAKAKHTHPEPPHARDISSVLTPAPMANRGEVHNHPAQHVMDRPRHQYHLLDAARALMLLGAVAAVSAVGNPDADGDAAQVMLGFVTWLLGVGLLSLVPVAGRFPQADALAGAAIANAGAVLMYLFTPWN